MTKSLYWRRPPTAIQAQGGVGYPTKGIVAKVLFEYDGSVSESAELTKGSAGYHYLSGVRDTTHDESVRAELSDLLALVDECGTAEVFTE